MRIISAWLSWSEAPWHWVLYILGLAVISAVTGVVLYYRDPPGEAADFERELDREFGPPRYLPGPVASAEALGYGRAGEHHHLEQPRYPELDPMLRPGWLEDQLAKGRQRHARQMYMQGRWRAQMLAEIAGYAT
jgi:hypothetical protein